MVSHHVDCLVTSDPLSDSSHLVRGEITQQVKVSNTFFHFHRSIMEQTSLSNNRLSKSLKTAKSTCEYANIRDQCAIQEFLKTCDQKPEDQESGGSANS